MNMLGVALASKALNNMSKGSGRGGHYYGGSELSEEEEFLINCKEIIESCSNMPGNEGSFIPIKPPPLETKEIKFDCFETTDEMVTTVKVVKVTENTLELDFDGEIRTFEKEK